VDRDEVRRVAELARLEIPETRIDSLAHELSAILDFVATLSRLDLASDQPLGFAPEHAPLREDATDGRRLDAEAALAAAPERDDGFFLVPPIVENVNP
jgi:aspartyl-tRNA(Asn)/glutamyl-tRNA(Gln) amidotransferase subunit C